MFLTISLLREGLLTLLAQLLSSGIADWAIAAACFNIPAVFLFAFLGVGICVTYPCEHLCHSGIGTIFRSHSIISTGSSSVPPSPVICFCCFLGVGVLKIEIHAFLFPFLSMVDGCLMSAIQGPMVSLLELLRCCQVVMKLVKSEVFLTSCYMEKLVSNSK